MVPRQPDPEKPLVVAQVKVGLAPVIKDKHLPVLERRHRASVRVLFAATAMRGGARVSIRVAVGLGRRAARVKDSRWRK